jgi:hypothetical protein
LKIYGEKLWTEAQWQAVVNMAISLWVSQKARKFSTDKAIISFSRRTQFCGFS